MIQGVSNQINRCNGKYYIEEVSIVRPSGVTPVACARNYLPLARRLLPFLLPNVATRWTCLGASLPSLKSDTKLASINNTYNPIYT
jgi:hypothetical protein